MKSTAQAMSKKLFDEIGVVSVERRGDPIVLGRIVRDGARTSPLLSFLIAWYVDTKDLLR